MTSGDAILTEIERDAMVVLLPKDPDELLTGDQKSSLSSDLATLARLRRDAEMVSANLKLA